MDTKLKIGERVELLPGRENVYDNVYPATRGVISGMRKDKLGYPQVYIIWDKGHWRYKGEPDMWTFAKHFRPVEEDERELGDTGSYEIPSAPPTEDEYEIPTDREYEGMEDYMDALINAADRASESDAFFFICLKQDEEGQNGLEMLHAIADDKYRNISIADVFAFAEREMRRRGM